MNAPHTPGPFAPYHADGYVEIRAGLEIIGRAEGQDAATDWANASLLAAAPDLLAACEDDNVEAEALSEWASEAVIPPSMRERIRGIVLRTRAALSKARGGR